MTLDLRILVDGGYRETDVGAAVQAAVRAAVPCHTVAVHVREIDFARVPQFVGRREGWIRGLTCGIA
ncbi:MAG: hypothetical protein H0W37_06100 [Pseudonocardiales bacterium]|nr:hypothetical protein [Pseudonocardiales bacterium]